MLEIIAKLWNTTPETLKTKKLEDIQATYIYESKRGGRQLMIGQDGSYLQASSGVSFEKLLERFLSGERNGKI